VFFENAEMRYKGKYFDKCTVRVEISVNSGKTKNFCPKKFDFIALKWLEI